MKNLISFIILLCAVSLSGQLYAKSDPVKWPLQGVNILEGYGTGWNEKFYGNRERRLFSFAAGGLEGTGKAAITENLIYTFSISPDHVKFFSLLDVNVFTAWSNTANKLELVIFSKKDEHVLTDTIKLSGPVDDLDLKFGQGRRPAFLFQNSDKNVYKSTLWFDEREQVIFNQNSPGLTGLLHWADLSAFLVTRSGTKTVLKEWQKGLTNTYDLPFLPIFAKMMIFDNKPVLFAIDTNSTLWLMRIQRGRLIGRKLFSNNEFAYANKLELLKSDKSYKLILHSSQRKKMFVLSSTNTDLVVQNNQFETFDMMDESSIFPGLVAGKLFWLESNKAGYTYLTGEDDQYNPLLGLNWTVSTAQGFPEINFNWKSQPANKKYTYRYIVDMKPASPPLPDYQLKQNNLNVKLSNEGDYYLHIQAFEPQSQWESIVYHIPVFWKYKPETPDIYLLNEISPKVVTGDSINFVIHNLSPLTYYAEVNATPVYEPGQIVNTASGEVQIKQVLKPGKFYLHIRSRDPRTNTYSQTLHHLFFYQTYVSEFTVGTMEYNKDLGRLNALIDAYRNAQSTEEKEKIMKEIQEFRQNLESDIEKTK